MSLRDLALILFFTVSILATFKRPWVGAILMAWVGFMNPQTMTWGIARSVPFAALAVMITIFAILINLKKTRYVVNNVFITVYLFWAWGVICTIFSFYPEDAMIELMRFTKIQVILLLTILVITDEKKLLYLVAAIALSLGFWGVKGGLFSLMTGGAYRIWGPEKTFIGGNNEIGLATLMNIPLLYFLYTYVSKRWLKWGFAAACLLSMSTVLFTYSRGAFLGLLCMSFFLWLKSQQKLPLMLLSVVLVIGAVPFIPEAWFERINTIQSYEEDASATGRLNAWQTAFNLANDKITAGGYRFTSELTFALYAPNPDAVHDMHSIYFEVLGETGWVGFGLFALMHWLNWRAAGRIAKRYKEDPSLKWVANLSNMVQVSLVGYYSGGAFLGLAYWDMPYYLMLVVLLLDKLVVSSSQVAMSTEKVANVIGERQQ